MESLGVARTLGQDDKQGWQGYGHAGVKSLLRQKDSCLSLQTLRSSIHKSLHLKKCYQN